MAYLTGSWDLDVIVLGIIMVYFLYRRQSKHFCYWRDRNVPYIEPHWIFGSMKNEIFEKGGWRSFCKKGYLKFKERGFGGFFFFSKPLLFICDPRLIEKVLVEDFSCFHDRMVYIDEPLGQSLLSVPGERWRKMRLRLAASFSSKKMKTMYDQVFKSCDYTLEAIDRGVREGQSISVEPLMYQFSTEVVASCSFGIQLLSDSGERDRFVTALQLFTISVPLYLVKCWLVILSPKLFSALGLTTQNYRVTEYFVNLTKSTIRYRETNRIERNDFLQLLISLKDQEENNSYSDITGEETRSEEDTFPAHKNKVASGERIFSVDCIAAFMYSFLTSGVGPSYSTLNFALFEIAKSVSIQKKLQVEIDVAIARHGGCTFEAIKDMKYLDQVIQETLRVYCFTTCLNRQVTEPYRLPGTDLTLDKGMSIVIPVAALHLDPRHYPSPHEFIPERFVDNNFKSSSTFLPFGHGPKICISIRFALIMMKVCLARILSKYTVRVSDRMSLPLEFDQNQLTLTAVGGIWLSFKER